MGSYGCNSGPRILTFPAHILILLLLLAFSPRGTRILQPGEKPRWQQGRGRRETVKGARPLPAAERPGDLRGRHQVPQYRGHEPSGKASREPQDPYSYGRRRWREAEARLGSQDSGLQRGGHRSAQLAG
ncbi:hypothetical protein H8959_006674 [Pygathrix nigripes]